MANPHRTNVLVTSCLKTPVDPHTKAPLASYERERVLPYTATAHMDNRDYEKEVNTVKLTLMCLKRLFDSYNLTSVLNAVEATDFTEYK